MVIFPLFIATFPNSERLPATVLESKGDVNAWRGGKCSCKRGMQTLPWTTTKLMYTTYVSSHNRSQLVYDRRQQLASTCKYCCIMQHPVRLLLIILILCAFTAAMGDSLFRCGPACEHSFDNSRGLLRHRSHCLHYKKHSVLQSDLPHKCSWCGVLGASKNARIESDKVGCWNYKRYLKLIAIIILGSSSSYHD